MLTELLEESQITLPQVIIDKMGLSVGDLLEITERDGGVFIMPAVASQDESPEMSQMEYLLFLDEMCGCIDDSTFVEPPEIPYESPREPVE